MCKVTMNEEKNGIEIRFDEKPDKAVLEMLKDGGFRWSQKQKMWYAKKNDERMSLVANLDSVSVETKAEKVNTQDNVYDLFKMTRPIPSATTWIRASPPRRLPRSSASICAAVSRSVSSP